MYLHEMRAILENIFLNESLDSIIKDNTDIPEEVIRKYHSDALDDNNKSDRALNFVLKLHRKGEIIPDEAKNLKNHMRVVSKLNLFPKLKEVDSLSSLHELTSPHIDKVATKKELNDADSPVVFENEHIKITQHKTHDSAVKGAMLHKDNPVANQCSEKGKAQWCLSVGGESGKSYFDSYTRNGSSPLYTIFNKKTKRVHALVADPSKSVSDRELRDEKDRNMYDDYPSLNNFINSHKGIEDSVVGEHLFKGSDIPKGIHKELPADATPEKIREVAANLNPNFRLATNLNLNPNFRQAALAHPNAPHDLLASKIHIPHTSMNPNLPKHLLATALEHPDDEVRNMAVKHHKLTSDQIDKFITDKNATVRTNAVVNNDLSSDQIDRFITDENANVRHNAISKPNSSSDQINFVLKNDKHPAVKRLLMSHKNIDNSHIQTALNDADEDVQVAAIQHKKATEEDLSNALDNGSEKTKIAALDNKNINSNHIIKALDDKNANVRNKAASVSFLPKHIDKALDDKETSVRFRAISNPNANTDNIDKALNDSYKLVRETAAAHPNITPSQIDKALDDESPHVREKAAMNKNATSNNLEKALNDENNNVRYKIAQHKNVTGHQLDKLLNDEKWTVRSAAAESPNATKEHIKKAMEDSSYHVRKSAMSRSDLDHDLLMSGLHDTESDVRDIAIKNSGITKKHLEHVLSDAYPYRKSFFDQIVQKIAQKRLESKDYNE